MFRTESSFLLSISNKLRSGSVMIANAVKEQIDRVARHIYADTIKKTQELKRNTEELRRMNDERVYYAQSLRNVTAKRLELNQQLEKYILYLQDKYPDFRWENNALVELMGCADDMLVFDDAATTCKKISAVLARSKQTLVSNSEQILNDKCYLESALHEVDKLSAYIDRTINNDREYFEHLRKNNPDRRCIGFFSPLQNMTRSSEKNTDELSATNFATKYGL